MELSLPFLRILYSASVAESAIHWRSRNALPLLVLLFTLSAQLSFIYGLDIRAIAQHPKPNDISLLLPASVNSSDSDRGPWLTCDGLTLGTNLDRASCEEMIEQIPNNESFILDTHHQYLRTPARYSSCKLASNTRFITSKHRYRTCLACHPVLSNS